MPRNGRIVLLVAAFGLAVGSTRAQDDLGPPPKPPVKAAPVTLPPDDLDAPPVPLKKSAVKEKVDPAKQTIDFPGVDLPSDPPQAKGKKTPQSKVDGLSAPKVAPTLKTPTDAKKSAPELIAFPSGEEATKKTPSTVEMPPDPPKKAATDLLSEEKKAVPSIAETPNIKLSRPIPAESNRNRKPATLQPVDPPVVAAQQPNEIPAPAAQKSNEPIAASDPPHIRHAPKMKKTINVEMAKPAEEQEEKSPIVQAAAIVPVPKPQDQYELVQPRLPNYDVVHAKSSRQPDADALRVVYESPEMLAGDGVIQAGATMADAPAPAIESYQVRIWKIDGWETFQELARMEYRDEGLAAPLAKYNRSGFRPGDALPAGQKVRLPPKWVLERSGTTVARRPAPIKNDFIAPPATSVQGQPAGSGMVASSGDRSKPGSLVKNGGASPLPKETTPPEAGRVFVVNEKDMTLYKVAKRILGDGSQWKQIYDLNRDRLSSSQAELKVGTRLRVPEGSMIR